MTAAAADDLIPRHRSAPPSQPPAATSYGTASNSTQPHAATHYGPVNHVAATPYGPVSASTAGALAARFEADGEAGQVEPLGPGWLAVTVVVGVMAALIALGGMVLSFRAVSSEMVPAFGARWAWLVPIVVDLTVFVFSGVDLVLARLDMGHPLARWTVYGATGGTVWLNYSAGGTAAGRVAHVLMPAIWVVFVELMRHVVRRQVNLSTASHREAIPAARWLLSPWPTLKLWRRMVLWRINSYPRALDQEKMRLGAVATAREMHGRFWRIRISPLTRLQINLGEVGAGDLRPDMYAEPVYAEPAAQAPVPRPAPAPDQPAQTRAAGPTLPRQSTGPGDSRSREPAVFASQPLTAATSAPVARAAGPALAAALADAQSMPAAAAVAPANGTGPSNGTRPNGAAPAATAPPPDTAPPDSAARQDAPHVEFQAPPPMPPLPRRSVRESELLTAAREVERWRGQPSATRISRELGIGMALATSLVNALREEEGLGE